MNSMRTLQNPRETSTLNAKPQAPKAMGAEPLQEGASPGALRRAITAIGKYAEMFASAVASSITAPSRKTAGITAVAALSACIAACDPGPAPYMQEDTDTESATDADTDSDTDTDADTDSDTDTGTETDTWTDSESATDADTDSDADTDADTDTDSDTDTETDTASDTETDSETDTETDTEPHTLMEIAFLPSLETEITVGFEETCSFTASSLVKVSLLEGNGEFETSNPPFGFSGQFNQYGHALFIARANDPVSATSDCVALDGIDNAKMKVILMGLNGKNYAHLETTGNLAGHVSIKHDQAISYSNILHFYDHSGSGYPTPVPEDMLCIARGTPIWVGYSETAEALCSAILWGNAFRPPQLPLAGTGMVYHPFKLEDLYSPTANGDVLAATTLPSLGGIADNSVLVQGDVTNGEITLKQVLETLIRLRIKDL